MNACAAEIVQVLDELEFAFYPYSAYPRCATL